MDREKTINLLSSTSFVQIYNANIKELSIRDSRLDREFLFHIFSCFLLGLILRVYIGEEDQYELYCLYNGVKTLALRRNL